MQCLRIIYNITKCSVHVKAKKKKSVNPAWEKMAAVCLPQPVKYKESYIFAIFVLVLITLCVLGLKISGTFWYVFIHLFHKWLQL